MQHKEHYPLSSWMEVVVHTHSRLGELTDNPQTKEVEDSLNNGQGQCSVKGLLEYTRLFFKHPIQIIDTDHPFHILDLQGIPRRGCYLPEQCTTSIEIMSQGILNRARTIREHFPSDLVLTGVEANILDRMGTIDISSSTLSKLDIVIASYHQRIWKGANGYITPSKEDILESILHAVENPFVDILGHPVRGIPDEVIAIMKPEEWNDIFNTLKENDTAFEINMTNPQIDSVNFDMEKALIKKAAEMGVSLCLGIDFHNFKDLGGFAYEGVCDEEKAKQIFEQNRNLAHFRMILRLSRVIQELSNLGINPEMVVNHSKQSFYNWLLIRKAKKVLQ